LKKLGILGGKSMLLINSKEYKDSSVAKPKNETDINENRDKDHKKITIQQEQTRVSKLADQVSLMLSSLQHLDEKSVIWPEVEERWAIKEEQEKELSSGIDKLQQYFPFLEREVQQSKENLQRIEDDLSRLNRQEPKESYSKAKETAEKQYFDAVGSKDSISAVLAKAQMVLDASRKKRFPGRKPMRQFPSSGAKSGGEPKFSQSTGSQSSSKKLDDETTGLISLGPFEEKTE
jgi:hypothetical protein